MTMDQARMNAWAVAIADGSMFAMLESELVMQHAFMQQREYVEQLCGGSVGHSRQ